MDVTIIDVHVAMDSCICSYLFCSGLDGRYNSLNRRGRYRATAIPEGGRGEARRNVNPTPRRILVARFLSAADDDSKKGTCFAYGIGG